MKLAVLGLGFMGSTHLKAWKKIPNAELAAVASDVPAALTGDLSHIQGNVGGPGERFDFSNVRKYTNAEDAIADPDVEIVDICLPTNLHAATALAALKAGKHVLVEKPMALSASEADAILAAARNSRRVLMAAQVVRFIPSYSVTRELVQSGRLGPVRAAMFRRRCAAPAWSLWLGNKTLSGGGIFDLLIHDIDFCLHTFGRPEAISATGYEDLPHGIDWITATLYYPQFSAVISGGWHHPKAFPFSMEYTVVGDNGTIEFSSDDKPPALYTAQGEKQVLTLPARDGYEAELEYFFECCAENRQPAFCPPEESANAVKLGLLMLDARNKNGEKIACKF